MKKLLRSIFAFGNKICPNCGGSDTGQDGPNGPTVHYKCYTCGYGWYAE